MSLSGIRQFVSRTLDEWGAIRLADLQYFGVRQLADTPLGWYADLPADIFRELRADAMNVLKCDDDALLRRNVDACDTGHTFLLKS